MTSLTLTFECPNCHDNSWDPSKKCIKCGYSHEDPKSTFIFRKNDILIKKFRVDEIKSGGMGVVYLCTELVHNKKVAVKTLLPIYFENIIRRKLFIQESENWIRLGFHPNIVRADMIEMINEFPAIILEFIDEHPMWGETLNSRLNRGFIIDEKTLLSYMIDICSGMIYAKEIFNHYSKPFVHRDLKPSNLLITSENVVKISDFGLIGGTKGYESPEQIIKQNLTEQSDIYSFGIIIQEIIDHNPSLLNLAGIKELLSCCLSIDVKYRYNDFYEILSDTLYIYNQTFKAHFIPNTGINLPTDPFTYLTNKAASFGMINNHLEAHKMFQEIQKYFENLNTFPIKEDEKDLLKQEIVRNTYNIANSLFSMNNFSDAEYYLKECLKISEKTEYQPVWNLLGLIHLERNQFYEAKNYFEKGLQLNPNNTDLLINYAQVLRKIGNSNRSLTILLDLYKKNPYNTIVIYNIAILYRDKKDIEKSIIYLEEARKIRPDYPLVLNELGAMYLLKLDLVNSLLVYRYCLVNEIITPDILINHALTLYHLKIYFERYKHESIFKNLVNGSDDFVYEAVDVLNKALNLLYAEIDTFPNNPDTWYRIARIWDLFNEKDKALYAISRSLNLSPNHENSIKLLQELNI